MDVIKVSIELLGSPAYFHTRCCAFLRTLPILFSSRALPTHVRKLDYFIILLLTSYISNLLSVRYTFLVLLVRIVNIIVRLVFRESNYFACLIFDVSKYLFY